MFSPEVLRANLELECGGVHGRGGIGPPPVLRQVRLVGVLRWVLRRAYVRSRRMSFDFTKIISHMDTVRRESSGGAQKVFF